MAHPTRFGALLKEFREARRLSQLRLSRELGVADSTISQWENGHRGHRLKRDSVLRLCEVLGLDDLERLALLEAADLDTPEDRKPQREQISVSRAIRLDPYLTSQEKDRLVELYETLTERRRPRPDRSG